MCQELLIYWFVIEIPSDGRTQREIEILYEFMHEMLYLYSVMR